METRSYKTIDRKKLGWPAGEWDDEPDKIQYQDEQTGLPCLIVRNPLGALCGYVGVDKKHPFYGKHYNDVDVSVHWGLTFSDSCGTWKDDGQGICHIPDKNEPHHVWWLGFDCLHSGDTSPGMMVSLRLISMPIIRDFEEYRNINFVKEQISLLAKQIKQAGRSLAKINRFRKNHKPKYKR